MRKSAIKLFVLVPMCIVGGSWAVAQQRTVVKPLDGYVCMGLKTDKEFGDDWAPGSVPPKPGQPGFSGFPVFQSPTEGSKVLGYQVSTVFVAWPEDEVDGFIKIVRMNKEKAWIRKDILVPFGMVVGKDGRMVKQKRTCTPVEMSDGTIATQIHGAILE